MCICALKISQIRYRSSEFIGMIKYGMSLYKLFVTIEDVSVQLVKI